MMFRFLKSAGAGVQDVDAVSAHLLDLAEKQLQASCRKMDHATALILEQGLLIDRLNALLLARDSAVLAYSEEVTRLAAQDLEQLERLTAYARWCDQQGCAPTDADLEAMLQG